MIRRALLCLAVAGCVGSGDAPCDSNASCLPGWVCRASLCTQVAGPIGPMSGIGASGGTVTGPDGVWLEIPRGALSETHDLAIRRDSASVLLPGAAALSMAYAIEPGDLMLASEATLVIPIAGDEDPRRLAVWSGTATGAWSRLEGGSTSTLAVGLTRTPARFVAGLAR